MIPANENGDNLTNKKVRGRRNRKAKSIMKEDICE
jgi:hypothetical protein